MVVDAAISGEWVVTTTWIRPAKPSIFAVLCELAAASWRYSSNRVCS
jgi:hypothetical protein